MKNLLNSKRKYGRKPKDLIYKKLLKLNEETNNKTDHLLLYRG